VFFESNGVFFRINFFYLHIWWEFVPQLVGFVARVDLVDFEADILEDLAICRLDILLVRLAKNMLIVVLKLDFADGTHGVVRAWVGLRDLGLRRFPG
jgi:hypothetical protein